MNHSCPKCLSPLSNNATGCRCSQCGLDYPQAGSILDLRVNQKPPVSYIVGGYDKLRQTLEEARTDYHGAMVKHGYFYQTDPRKALWKQYTEINKKSVVLDFGSGLGGIAYALAGEVAWVEAVDQDLVNLELVSLGREYFKRPNIGLARIDPIPDYRLPYADGIFDFVVLNGIVEWLAVNLTGNPRENQLRCLREFLRVLKKGGQIYIGIENRFGFEFLAGFPDNHTGYLKNKKRLRFTTLMPRMLADMVSRLIIKEPYRTYTYGRGGYRQLLRDAGMSATQIVYPFPDYRQPVAVYDESQSQAIRTAVLEQIKGTEMRAKGRLHKAYVGVLKTLVKTCNLYDSVPYSYGIISRK